MKNVTRGAIITTLLVVGGGSVWAHQGEDHGTAHKEPMAKNSTQEQASTGEAKDQSMAKEPTVYTCPMHPEVRQNKPGSCPKCGMTLEPEQKADMEQQTGDRPAESGNATESQGSHESMHHQ